MRLTVTDPIDGYPRGKAAAVALSVPLVYYITGYFSVGIWQLFYMRRFGISAEDMELHMEDYSLRAAEVSTYVNIIMAGTALLLFAVLFSLRGASPVKRMGLTSGRVTAPAAVAAVIVGACLYLPLGELMSLIPFPESLVQSHKELLNASRSPLWVQVLYSAAIAPLCEELLFRGVAYDRLSRAFPVPVAVVFGAAVFGIAHGQTVAIVNAALCGAVMCLLYERGRSVVLPLLFHVSYNSLGLLSREGIIPRTGRAYLILLVISALLLAVGAVLLFYKKSDSMEIKK